MKDDHIGLTARRKVFLTILVIYGIVHATPLWGKDSHEEASRGPIRVRNQFPLGLQFLGFVADDNQLMKPHKLRLDFHYAHSNTFVKSNRIVRNLQLRDGRSVLTREVAEQIARERPDSDAFLLDVEATRWSLNVLYTVSNATMIEAELPILRFSGGFLDPAIEHFHSNFGFPDDSRPAFRKNITEVFLYVDRQFLHLGPNDIGGAGLGDLVLSSKFRLFSGKRSNGWPIITARAAIKLPTGDPQKLYGSGSMDYGLHLAATKLFTKSNLHLNLGAMVPGKWKLLPGLNLSPVYSALLGYEHFLGKNASLIIQNLISSNVLAGVTDSALGKVSHEVTAGVTIDHPKSLRWTVSLTENYVHYNNAPDIGIHIGVTLSLR
jgi:hypothetical protein